MNSTTVDERSGLYKGAEPGEPPRFRYRYLYYITHIDNISSILKNGVLSHEQIEERKINYVPIYNENVVSLRKDKKTPDGKSLWYYANFYFQPRNPMLYAVRKKFRSENIAVIACYRGDAIDVPGALVTDGNAASNPTQFFPANQLNKVLKNLRSVDGLEYWNEEDGSKRKMMAEVLIPESYGPEKIHSILVSSELTKDKVDSILSNSKFHPHVLIDPRTFFDPDYESKITDSLTLVRGDMFFSGLQTLTVSVNTKGVMGKGLASRAKYQFPDVYIKYQDACRNKSLKLGRPVLYKREAALDVELADEPYLLEEPNNHTWFLLFATKEDWRDRASKEGIIQGLEWLVKYYRKEEIKSLAIPALGCGLGWLDWKDMGPVLCKYLSKLEIPVQLYVPAEKPIPDEQLTKEFLLGNQTSNLDIP